MRSANNSALDEIKQGKNVTVRRRLEQKDPQLMLLGFEATKAAAMYPAAQPILPLLLDAGFPLTHNEDSGAEDKSFGRNALHYLMGSNAVEYDVNEDPRQATLSGKTVSAFNPKWVKAFVSILSHMERHDISINTADQFGMTPVMLAVDSGFIDQALYAIQEHHATVDGLYKDDRSLYGVAFDALMIHANSPDMENSNELILDHPIFNELDKRGLIPNHHDINHENAKLLSFQYSKIISAAASAKLSDQQKKAEVEVQANASKSVEIAVKPEVKEVKQTNSLFARFNKPANQTPSQIPAQKNDGHLGRHRL